MCAGHLQVGIEHFGSILVPAGDEGVGLEGGFVLAEVELQAAGGEVDVAEYGFFEGAEFVLLLVAEDCLLGLPVLFQRGGQCFLDSLEAGQSCILHEVLLELLGFEVRDLAVAIGDQVARGERVLGAAVTGIGLVAFERFVEAADGVDIAATFVEQFAHEEERLAPILAIGSDGLSVEVLIEERLGLTVVAALDLARAARMRVRGGHVAGIELARLLERGDRLFRAVRGEEGLAQSGEGGGLEAARLVVEEVLKGAYRGAVVVSFKVRVGAGPKVVGVFARGDAEPRQPLEVLAGRAEVGAGLPPQGFGLGILELACLIEEVVAPDAVGFGGGEDGARLREGGCKVLCQVEARRVVFCVEVALVTFDDARRRDSRGSQGLS